MAKKKSSRAVSRNKSINKSSKKKLDWWSSLWGDKPLAVSVIAAVVVGLFIILTKGGITGKVSTQYGVNLIENGGFNNGIENWIETGVGSWKHISDSRSDMDFIEQYSKSKNTGLYQSLGQVEYGAYIVQANVKAIGDSVCSVYIDDNTGNYREIRSTSDTRWILLTNTNLCDENSGCRVATFSTEDGENTCQFDDIKVSRYN